MAEYGRIWRFEGPRTIKSISTPIRFFLSVSLINYWAFLSSPRANEQTISCTLGSQSTESG